MDYVRKTIVLTPELAKFAEKKIKRMRAETGEYQNISKYVRSLISKDFSESKAAA